MEYYAIINKDLNRITSWYVIDGDVRLNIKSNEVVYSITKEQAEFIGSKEASFIVVNDELQITKLFAKSEDKKPIYETTTEQLKQETADQAFQIMLLESEVAQQKQAIADLEFNLMMGGVI